MRRAITVVVLLLLSPHSAAAQRLSCGGLMVDYDGGMPPMGLVADARGFGFAPTVPEPAEWTERERELWDALVFNGHERPEGVSDEATRMIDRDVLASINICQQAPDVSDTGMLMEPHDAAWWRQTIQWWSGQSWSGDYVRGDCADEPEDGWLHIRQGEESDPNLAYATAYARVRRHWSLTEVEWHAAEIVIWPYLNWQLPNQHLASAELTEQVLTHELGQVMGFWHVPQETGFVMRRNSGADGGRTPKERELANLAYRVGPRVRYPGVVGTTPVPALPLGGLIVLAVVLAGLLRRY